MIHAVSHTARQGLSATFQAQNLEIMNPSKSPWAPAALLLGTLALCGCSDANVDLQRQITVLREELERTRQEAAAHPSPSAPRNDPAPTAQAVADSNTVQSKYEAAGRSLRSDLEQRLSGEQLENFTLYQPQFEPFPFKSEFSMEFRSAGHHFTIDHIPVKASADGAWVFPTVESILTQIEKAKTATLAQKQKEEPIPSPAPAPQRGANRPEAASTKETTAPAAANKTIVVRWEAGPAPKGGSGGTAPGATGTNTAPAQIMPSQRDVQVKF